ncbi:MAG: hypothetical protein HOP15_14675 [Planctomycetes bacterium]|nr:hypothetical protein [Planctomycetota bacterium]
MERKAWSAVWLACAAGAVLACGSGSETNAGARVPGESSDPSHDYTFAMLDQQVFINGVALDEQRLREFQQRYGQGPRPGRYWYDAKSGLFGHEGGPTLGWIHPGHDFGALPADASRGSTGVFVNGRQLDVNDYTALASIEGGVIQQGRYWLDGLGNYGYEGYGVDGHAVPAGNLYLLLQMQAQSGGGDNAWSTRFSSGNSTGDNSAGYVQCPDGTFVSYGM